METNDPLSVYDDTPSSQTDTSFPKLKAGIYDLVFASAEVKPTEKGTERLALTLKTTKDAFDKEGQGLASGFPIYHNVGLTPTDDYPAKSINRNLNSILKAVGLGSVTARQLVSDP